MNTLFVTYDTNIVQAYLVFIVLHLYHASQV